MTDNRKITQSLFVVLLCMLIVSISPVTAAEKEKAASKAEKTERQLNEIQQEIQDEIDDFARSMVAKSYRDDFLQGYVNELGQSLVPKETPAGVLFSFRVINDPTVNAVALPDGRIFVHSGLLTFVENEAQLSMILGHEIGHVVERHSVEAIQAARSLKRSLFAGLMGAATGAITRDKEAAQTVFTLTAASMAASYSQKQELEADQVGTTLSMAGRFDPSQGIAFFQKLKAKFGDGDSVGNLLFGSHPRNLKRAENIQKLLDGELSADYSRLRSAGELTTGRGLFRLHASGMIRETAIVIGEVLDRYDISKYLLESILDVRARDPKTLWYLGRVYRLVARTDEQKNKALELLQRAVEADARTLYPEINLDLGLMLASRTGNVAAGAESLKRYVVAYTQKRGEQPPNLEQIYDYLLLFGDNTWTAPEPENSVIKAIEAVRMAQQPAPPPPQPPAVATQDQTEAKNAKANSKAESKSLVRKIGGKR